MCATIYLHQLKQACWEYLKSYSGPRNVVFAGSYRHFMSSSETLFMFGTFTIDHDFSLTADGVVTIYRNSQTLFSYTGSWNDTGKMIASSIFSPKFIATERQVNLHYAVFPYVATEKGFLEVSLGRFTLRISLIPDKQDQLITRSGKSFTTCLSDHTGLGISGVYFCYVSSKDFYVDRTGGETFSNNCRKSTTTSEALCFLSNC